MSRLDYASQLWSPYLLKHIYLIEKVQRTFTKHISGLRDFSFSKRLETLKLYSLQRRRDWYSIIYVWKDWFQTSLILSPVLSLIVGEEPVLYTMSVSVDWAPWNTIALDGDLLVLLIDLSLNSTPIWGTLWIFPASPDLTTVWTAEIAYMAVITRMT